MAWTHNAPTEPGWYGYYCAGETAEPVIAWVVTDLNTGALAVFFFGSDEVAELPPEAWWSCPILLPEFTEPE